MGLQKAKDPQEEMKKWRRELRKEQRAMDREISKLEQMERKSRDECRKYGKEGRQDACKIVAREIVRTRAARNRRICGGGSTCVCAAGRGEVKLRS